MKLPSEKKTQLCERLEMFLAKQTSKCDSRIFSALYRQFLEEDAHIDWNSWEHIGEDVQKTAEDLAEFDSNRTDVLRRVAIVKLNGGLGTTMGCNEPKSFIELRNGLSFLDIAVEQHKKLNEKYSSKVPMYLMNSFYTNKATIEKLKENAAANVFCFEQSRCPRIKKESLLPVEDADWEDDAWYPPGHGNIFEALSNTGTLDELLSQGRDILFVSNIDNTGATLELSIAQFMADQQLEYVMECTEKTQNDIKGGTLISINGRLMHLEMPQVPPDHLEDFCSTKVFKIFNTNNIWVNLHAVKRLLPNIKSEIIVNYKKVRKTDVIQLETSIGGCIRNFEKAYCVHVRRNRFRPVKRVEDLICMSSNLFELTPDYNLSLLASDVPAISLGSCYTSVAEKNARMPKIPDLVKAKSFNITGDVAFEGHFSVRGDLSIVNNSNQQAVIPAGSEFYNENVVYN